MSGRVSLVVRLAVTPEPVKPSETALALLVTPGEVQAADAVPRTVIDDEALRAWARTSPGPSPPEASYPIQPQARGERLAEAPQC